MNETYIEELVRWLESERANWMATEIGKELGRLRAVATVAATRELVEIDGRKELSVRIDDVGAHERSAFATVHKSVPVRLKYSTVPAGVLEPGEEALPKSHAAFFESMLGDYVSRLARPEIADLHTAEAVAREYLAYVDRKTIVAVSRIRIGGIVPPNEEIVKPESGVSLRALSPAELGEALVDAMRLDLSAPTGILDVPRAAMGQDGLARIVPGCMLVLQREMQRGFQLEDDAGLGTLILALQLHGYDICGTGRIETWTEPGPRSGEIVADLRLPSLPQDGEKEISNDLLEEALSDAELIKERRSADASRAELTCRQFAIAAAHDDPRDALIAFVVALESLLVPGLHGENAFRFRLNGARWLADTADERRLIYEELAKLYKMRSSLVHGGSVDSSSIRRARASARSVAGRAVIKALRQGWPTADQFEASALA